ncbi:MAG TPA: response regulator [Polyangiaceae bacterium]|nr:response regulator [Polyangiaceae bacterium]
MSAGRVLIIEDDEWMTTLLARFLAQADHVVEATREARDGFARARRAIPDCVICDVALPDIDGFWVVRRVRAEPGPLSQVAFAFLAAAGDGPARLQGLEMGADIVITKPFREEEVVAQVRALIAMAQRLRRRRDSMLDIPPSSRIGGAAVFHGDLSQFSVATALALLEMERRTGTLKVKAARGDREIAFEALDGALARATSDGQAKDPIELIREVMKWQDGRFFYENSAITPADARQGIGALLLEAMRLEDEAHR